LTKRKPNGGSSFGGMHNRAATAAQPQKSSKPTSALVHNLENKSKNKPKTNQ
jgi:hypothetical protein